MGVNPVTMRRAVFVDRDGVLNRTVVMNGKLCPPARPEDVEILPRVTEACSALRAAGFLVIVVTNQPDVARGTQRVEVVEAINAVLRSGIPLDDIRVCYHDDADGCACRKPKPGLLLQAARDWQVDVSRSFVVGDRWRDVEAGRRAGCTTVLIDNHQFEDQQSVPDYRTASLGEAANWIINQGLSTQRGD